MRNRRVHQAYIVLAAAYLPFAVAAHPDDIEFFMSGTLLLLKQAGYDNDLTVGHAGEPLGERIIVSRRRRWGRRLINEFLVLLLVDLLVEGIGGYLEFVDRRLELFSSDLEGGIG